MGDAPRLTTIMGVARAVLATVGPRDAARVLVDEFGWDATFLALALLKGDDARETFGEVWSALALDAVHEDVAAATDEGAGRTTPNDAAPGEVRDPIR